MSVLSDIHEMVAKASGNKSCSFILLCWLGDCFLPELFGFCIPTKKKKKENNLL